MSSLAGADTVGLTSPRSSRVQRSDARGPRLSRQVAVDLVAIAEVLAVLCGALLPAYIYQSAGGVPVAWLATVKIGLIAAVIVVMCLRLWGFYEPARVGALPQHPVRLLGAVVVACLAVVGIGLPVPAGLPHVLAWYGTWVMLTFTLMVLIRWVAGVVLARLAAAGRFDVRIAVYGAGVVARRACDHLARTRDGIVFAGVFDDRCEPGRLNADGLTISGRLDDLVALGRADGVDRIVIALPASASDRIEAVARKLDQLPVSLHVVTHIASEFVSQGPAHAVSAIGPVGLLDVKRKPLADWAPVVKRIEDVLIGGILLVAALPLMLLIALAIKLDSRGPVFFIQRRRGLNQRVISVVKFRTMSVMEDGADVRQATAGDPRITRVGAFLRRSSLDELPQLFNVLNGDMSLVGPRPHAIAHDEHYGPIVDGYVNRHQVKPGITGLAQVRGFRGETRTDDKMQGRVDQDLAYIESWSPWLDLKILFATVIAVLRASNAR